MSSLTPAIYLFKWKTFKSPKCHTQTSFSSCMAQCNLFHSHLHLFNLTSFFFFFFFLNTVKFLKEAYVDTMQKEYSLLYLLNRKIRSYFMLLKIYFSLVIILLKACFIFFIFFLLYPPCFHFQLGM